MANPKELIYVSDLDGTLLKPNSFLPQEAIERLNYLLEKGLRFTIATARNYDSVQPILKNLNLNIPVILFNGVYLTNFQTGENLISASHIQKKLALDILKEANSEILDPFVYSFDRYHSVYYRNITNQGSKNYLNYIKKINNGNRLKHIESYKFLSAINIAGLLFIDIKSKLVPLYKKIQKLQKENLNIYFAEDIAVEGHYWLQIFDSQANKGNMLKQLAKRLKMPLEDFVVFGDYLNDLEMFEVAGQSIAMGNALAEVKLSADLIIGSNKNLSVINFLEEIGF